MSPRRQFGSSQFGTEGEALANRLSPSYFWAHPKPARRWGLPLIAALAAVVLGAAITASALMLVRIEADRRVALEDAAALGYAREFMAMYLTLDPSNDAGYVEAVLAESTGDFSQIFKEKQNEIRIQVARSQAAVGRVVEAGIQRHNDDGGIDVLLAMSVATATSDLASAVENGSRWIATIVQDGRQWKVSNLVQVI